jgi:hypothetical protein
MMDHDSFQAAQRKLYDGKLCALIRATGSSGKVTVAAEVEGLAPASITLATAPVSREDRWIANTAANERGF